RSLTTANLSMFLAFSGMFAMFFFNTLYIQKVLGFGPLKAGVAFLPFTAGIMLSAGLASNFAPRIGVRPIAVAGMVLTLLGLVVFVALLRKRHVARIEAEVETEPALANVA